MTEGVKPLELEREQQPSGRGSSLKSKMRLAILAGRVEEVGTEVAIFRVRPKEGEVFSFRAGQYATLGLQIDGQFIARAYSIASSPYTRRSLEFYINLIKEGQLTPAIFGLGLGDDVYFMGPKGVFTLEKTKAKSLLLVATGTGLAPYMSMLRKLHEDQDEGRPHGRVITLMHGVRHSEDLGYREELEALARAKNFNLLYLPVVSRIHEDPYWTSALGKGRVTDLLGLIGEELRGREVPALPQHLDSEAVLARFSSPDTAVYLCGNPDMTAEAKKLLVAREYREVYTEDYW